jgi:adenylate cyclase
VSTQEKSGLPLVAPQGSLPGVRIPIRLKIIFPYVILALLMVLAAAYLVSQIIVDTIEERFTNQLIEGGKLTNDWIVSEEDRLLQTLRLLTHIEGVPAAMAAQDAEQLRELTLPVFINYQEEAVEILDREGVSLLSLHRQGGATPDDYEANRGESVFQRWGFVQNVLNQQVDQAGDKYAGLAHAGWGSFLYVAGPVLVEQEQVGVILVGKSLPSLLRQIRADTLAHLTVYDFNGRQIASTFPFMADKSMTLSAKLASDVLANQNQTSPIRSLSLASINYSEILSPLQLREFTRSSDQSRQNNDVAIIGTSLADTFLARPTSVTRWQIFLITAIAFIVVIELGVYIAGRITHPLQRVVAASAKVAQGDLNVQVEAAGNDEVALLAQSFNEMVNDLREGSIYRDLLGRTVSPEVREQLRHGFASGDLRLQGQEAVATVLVSDIRGFTTLAEAQSPTVVMSWLNEYYQELVPVITSHGGVISKFEGDAVLAFFGILPQPLSELESAHLACRTALAMLAALENLNVRRHERGEPVFSAGIGLNTGPVIAGALGSDDRLHYTIIGDTVNAAARLEGLTRQFGGENGIVLSHHTLFALGKRRHDFEFDEMGVQTLKGKTEQLLVYHLRAAKARHDEPK